MQLLVSRYDALSHTCTQAHRLVAMDHTSSGLSEHDMRHTGLWSRLTEANKPAVGQDGQEHGESETQATDSEPAGRVLSNPKSLLSRLAHKLRGEKSHRFTDLLNVHASVVRDMEDSDLYPELKQDAELRRDNKLSPAEMSYQDCRKELIASSTAFRRLVGAGDEDEIDPRDVPVISFGGSGGGYRALLGFLGYIEEFQSGDTDLWSIISYVAGVSGSCWTLAALYTFGGLDASYLFEHFQLTSGRHPLSAAAIDAVARSADGVYFQLGPLLQKLIVKHLHPGPLDLYGTLLTTHLFLPPTEAKTTDDTTCDRKPKLQKEWYQWSRVFSRSGIEEGRQPLPVFTAVRHERPWKDWKSPEEAFGASDHTSAEHDDKSAWWQWFEMSPIEVGSDELEGWVPTWAFGRQFSGGKSTQRLPERSLSLLLGMCTSAPAGPLSAWLQTLYRNLPGGKFGSWLRHEADDWVDQHPKEAERLQSHHPIHAMNEANPFFRSEVESNRGQGFENSPRIHLVDAGMSNNEPLAVSFRPERDVDIILLGDYSSDVQGDGAIARIGEYGRERGYRLEAREKSRPPDDNPQPGHVADAKHSTAGADVNSDATPTAASVAAKFRDRYAQILDVVPVPASELPASNYYEDGVLYNERHQPQCTSPKVMVYMPLLPHSVQPAYDPATASFSSSYNLTWTEEQVGIIRRTARADAREAMTSIVQVIKEVYEKKRQTRLAATRDVDVTTNV